MNNPIALLFPGSGADYAGMGQLFYDEYEVFRSVMTEASDTLGKDLRKISFGQAPDPKTQMDDLQIAIYVVSVGMYQVFQQTYGDIPVMMAGNSLGEYSALTCAGILNFNDGLRIIQQRSWLLDCIGKDNEGKMMAVNGLDQQECEGLIRGLQLSGAAIYISNYNSPRQFVFSGNASAIELAKNAVTVAGGQFQDLRFPPCSHCPLMNPAIEAFEAFLQPIPFYDSHIPIYSNVTGSRYAHSQEIKASLPHQLTHPVLWEKMIRSVQYDGARLYIEMGPQRILKNICDHIDADLASLAFDSLPDRQLIDAFLKKKDQHDPEDNTSRSRVAAASLKNETIAPQDPSLQDEARTDETPANLTDIAVIGMSGKFPEAPNVETFYQNLKNGRDSVRALSLSRIRDTSLSPGRRYMQLGFLEDIDKFDFDFFHILRSEAECMAPQHRIMLQLAYEAIESAGYSPDEVAGSRTAVYMTSNHNDYVQLATEFNPTLLTGNLPSCIPGRIARYFNFTGNALHVDTACSSSLVALHMACQELLSGGAKMALCGGVHILVVLPAEEDIEGRNVSTSRQGKCLTFSAKADGAGTGEGAACLLLKPLRDAVKDKDNILAVIKATAVNQDAARSSTLTAPSSIAQSEVITMAIEKAGIDPTTISFIEAHGTGTKLGDPIEIEGLSAAFRKYTDQKQFCAISALKSNIGHCDVAAGLLGVIKTLLSMGKKELFPSLHVDDINPYINFVDSPLYLNLEHRPWDSPRSRRRAGVSSFGISGTNCHAILEEWVEPPVTQAPESPYLFMITGQTQNAVARNAKALRDFVHQHRDLSLERISYTLNTGKTLFSFRKAIIASTHDELIKELDELILPERSIPQPPEIWFLFSGSGLKGRDFMQDLCRAFPAFDKAHADCLSVLSGIDQEPLLDYCFGYSFYAFLKELGLDVRHVMGLDNGKDIAGIVTGKISLQELAATYPRENKPTAAAKWEEFVHKRLQGKRSLIWEIGLGSTRYKELDAYKNEEQVFESVNPIATFSIRELLTFFGKLSESGLALNFRALYTNIPWKIALPTYQFEDQHCWIRHAGNDQVSSWIYQQTWRSRTGSALGADLTKNTLFVIYCDRQGIGDRLSLRLKDAGYDVCKVYRGEQFALLPDGTVLFDWIDESAYAPFLSALTDRHADQFCHIHLGACAALASQTEQQFSAGLYPILLLAKALIQGQGRHSLRLITDRALDISGKEIFIDASGAAIHGLAAGIRAEMEGLEVGCIDIDAGEEETSFTQALFNEIRVSPGDLVIGLRNGLRYMREWSKPVRRTAIQLQGSGVYVITGGATGIGLQILLSISYCKATLIVIGRRRLPHRSLWPFVTEASHPGEYESIKGFLQAQANGANVIYFSADVSDDQRMRQVFLSITQQFGPVRGIIHSAGIGGKARIQRHSIESFRETLLPKAHGAENLYALSDKGQLDFFILFSSPNAIVAVERESNYSAANAFLDSFSAKLNREHIKSMTIRWPFWTETGMGMKMKTYEQFTVSPAISLNNKEGADVFDHILRQGYADVLVAKKDPGILFSTSGITSPHKKPNLPKAGNVRPASHSPIQETLTQIWQKVLSREYIGPDDNFFAMGGHSLLGLQVRNQVEKLTGIKLEYRDIAEYPTIKALAAHLKTLSPEDHNNQISLTGSKQRYPATDGQKGIWIASHTAQNGSLYNICFAFSIQMEVDTSALNDAVRHLMQRHEVLRTQFIWEEDRLYQSVLPIDAIGIPVQFIDEQDDKTMGHTSDSARLHSFELDKAPLFKIWLIKYGTRNFELLIAIHHVIIDGWSTRIFLDQLFSNYEQCLNNNIPVIPSGLMQYKDYATWESEQLSGPLSDRYKKFWIEYLKDRSPSLDLPLDFARSFVRKGEGSMYHFSLTPAHTAEIGQIGARYGGSKFIVCFAMLQILLYRYTGQQDFIIGTPSTLRNRPELEDQIGYYVNLLPLRCKVNGSDSFDALLHRSGQLLTTVQDHQVFPFQRILDAAGVTQIPGRQPLFDLLFTYEHELRRKPSENVQTKVKSMGVHMPNSKYDIEFILKEMDETIVGMISYDTSLFREDTIARIADHFIQLADAITLQLTVDRFSFESRSPALPKVALENMDFNI